MQPFKRYSVTLLVSAVAKREKLALSSVNLVLGIALSHMSAVAELKRLQLFDFEGHLASHLQRGSLLHHRCLQVLYSTQKRSQ
jgi:hypothetical protein